MNGLFCKQRWIIVLFWAFNAKFKKFYASTSLYNAYPETEQENVISWKTCNSTLFLISKTVVLTKYNSEMIVIFLVPGSMCKNDKRLSGCVCVWFSLSFPPAYHFSSLSLTGLSAIWKETIQKNGIFQWSLCFQGVNVIFFSFFLTLWVNNLTFSETEHLCVMQTVFCCDCTCLITEFQNSCVVIVCVFSKCNQFIKIWNKHCVKSNKPNTTQLSLHKIKLCITYIPYTNRFTSL